MNINAKYFGSVSFQENDLIFFPEGLLGFESYQSFLPIPLQEENDTLISLQSIDNENLSFIIINPFVFFPEYAPILSEKDKKELNIQSEDDLSYYAICVINESLSSSTANLKAPIVINAKSRVGKQIILDSQIYSFRHPIPSIEDRRE